MYPLEKLLSWDRNRRSLCAPVPKTIDIRRAALVAALSLAALCGWADPSQAQQDGARDVPELEVSARAWAVTDLRTGEYLAGREASDELPMASTTKVSSSMKMSWRYTHPWQTSGENLTPAPRVIKALSEAVTVSLAIWSKY